MAKITIGSDTTAFPHPAVFTPQERAKLIIEVAVAMSTTTFAAMGSKAELIAEDQHVNMTDSVKSAANVVYQAEMLATPPKVPQSS